MEREICFAFSWLRKALTERQVRNPCNEMSFGMKLFSSHVCPPAGLTVLLAPAWTCLGKRVRKHEWFQPFMPYLRTEDRQRGKRRKITWSKGCPEDKAKLSGFSPDYWTEVQGDRIRRERMQETSMVQDSGMSLYLLCPSEALNIDPVFDSGVAGEVQQQHNVQLCLQELSMCLSVKISTLKHPVV